MAKSRSPRRSSSQRRPLGALPAAVLIVLAGLAAYSNSFDGILVFDDEPAIAQNPHVRSVWPLTSAMAAPPDTTLSGRPVAALSFAIDYATSADALFAYHRTNLLIHLAAALLVFGITRRTLSTPVLAARFGAASTVLATTVALLFVVHPLQTGAVTYVVQRVESLMGLFYLATLYGAIRALDADGLARTRWTTASILACALGMGTKEVMATAPLMVMLWDWHFAARRMSCRRWLYTGLAATWIVLAILVAGGHRSLSAGFGFAQWPWWRYLITQAGVVTHYFRLALVPTGLVLDYDWRPSTMSQAALPIALIGVVLAATVIGVVRRRPAAFAVAWCFLVLAPSSSVIPIVTEVAAEHRMYLPVAGVMALVVTSAFEAGRLASTEAARRTLGRAGLLTAGAVAILFGCMTYARNADYHGYDRIWSDTIAKRPHNARARNNYATSLLMNGRYGEAERHLRVAVGERPDFAEAEGNLGVALASQGRLEEGATHLRRAIALRPDDAEVHRNLGENYMLQHRPGEAVKALSQALEYRPDDVAVLNRLAWILATTTDSQTRNGARARAFAERAVRLTARRDVDSLDNLGAALAETGQFEQAITVTTDAVTLARAAGQSALLSELEQRLAAYRARQPIRVP